MAIRAFKNCSQDAIKYALAHPDVLDLFPEQTRRCWRACFGEKETTLDKVAKELGLTSKAVKTQCERIISYCASRLRSYLVHHKDPNEYDVQLFIEIEVQGRKVKMEKLDYLDENIEIQLDIPTDLDVDSAKRLEAKYGHSSSMRVLLVNSDFRYTREDECIKHLLIRIKKSALPITVGGIVKVHTEPVFYQRYCG